MTSTTVRQPATAGVSSPARPPVEAPSALFALGKLAGLVLVIGVVLALLLAGALGVGVLLISHAASN